jgi:hypothetical protein
MKTVKPTPKNKIATKKQFKALGYDLVEVVNKHVGLGLQVQQVEDIMLHLLVSNMVKERCPHCLLLDVVSIMKVHGIEGLNITTLDGVGTNEKQEHVH